MPGYRLRRWAALPGLCLLVAVGLVAAHPAGGGFLAARPQGTIVFASDRSGNFEIYSVRADGWQSGSADAEPCLGRGAAFLAGRAPDPVHPAPRCS